MNILKKHPLTIIFTVSLVLTFFLSSEIVTVSAHDHSIDEESTNYHFEMLEYRGELSWVHEVYINDSDTIVANVSSSVGSGMSQVIIWNNEKREVILPLKGQNHFQNKVTEDNKVLGYVGDPFYESKGFIYDIEHSEIMYVDHRSHVTTNLIDMNNKGFVLGTALRRHSSEKEVFIWNSHDNTFTYLGYMFDSSSRARGINDKGDIIGAYYNGPLIDESGFITSMHNEEFVPEDLGSLGDYITVPHDINNNRIVVGTSSEAYLPTAFFWENGTIHNVKYILSASGFNSEFSGANGINEFDQIVGSMVLEKNGDMTRHGFLLNKNSSGTYTAIDLNSHIPIPELDIVVAEDINDQGTISGYGYTSETGYFIWKLSQE